MHKRKRLYGGLLVLALAHAAAAEAQGGKQLNPLEKQILTTLCSRGNKISLEPTFNRPSCEVCPSYTEFHGEKQGFSLGGFYRGHYSGSLADEIVAMLIGCEPRGSGGGGHALLRWEKGRWINVFYHPGLVGECLTFKEKSGKTVLFCLRSGGNNGYFVNWFVEARLDGDRFIENVLYRTEANDGSSPDMADQPNISVVGFAREPNNPERVRIILRDQAKDQADSTVYFRFDGDYFNEDAE